MSGPPPKPTELKKLSGNPGRRPLNELEPQPERVAPAMPRGMPKFAQRFWKAYAPKLEELGLLTAIDGPAFTMLALHYNVAWEAGRTLKDDGLITDDFNGMTRKHPLLQVMRDNSAMFLRYAVQFGLTPSARSQLKTGGPTAPDLAEALAELMKNM